MKIGLGTAQFGMDYGINNPGGKTHLEEVEKILAEADRQGVCILDTAPLYGNSEEVIGRSLRYDHPFEIITKTPKFNSPQISDRDVDGLEDTLYRSLGRLNQSSIYGLLIHQAEDVFKPKGDQLIERMHRLKQQGLIKKIGVSVYHGIQIDRLIARYSVDIIQLPINILDQRLLHSGHLSRLKQAGIEVHARSVFLQGLLLMDIDRLPVYFTPLKQHLEKSHLALQKAGVSPMQAALHFVTEIKEIDVVICGVSNRSQLIQLLDCARQPIRPIQMDHFAISDDAFLNPSKWKVK